MEPPLLRFVLLSIFALHSVPVLSQLPNPGDNSLPQSPPPPPPISSPPPPSPPPPSPPPPSPPPSPSPPPFPSPPPPPPPHYFHPPPHLTHRRHLPPPLPPPPPSKHKLNTGKKIGLLFSGMVVILQIGVLGYLVLQRRLLLK